MAQGSRRPWSLLLLSTLYLVAPHCCEAARWPLFSSVAFLPPPSSSSTKNGSSSIIDQRQSLGNAPPHLSLIRQDTKAATDDDDDQDTTTTTADGDTVAQLAALLPADLPRRNEAITMLEAVYKACHITQALQPLDHDAFESAVQKDDASPVTVADFAVQACILHHLQQQAQHAHEQREEEQNNNDPDIGFIAEEDSAVLRQDTKLGQRVAAAAGLSIQDTLTSIDLGKSYLQWWTNKNNSLLSTTSDRPSNVYCLDPIDGTRGFLRGKRTGGQYAIALALLHDGIPVIGVLGCPNLPHTDDAGRLEWETMVSDNDDEMTKRGCLFVAVQGGGCYQLPLVPPTPTCDKEAKRLRVSQQPADSSGDEFRRPLKDGRFCIGVEKYSDAQGQAAGMSQYIRRNNSLGNEDDSNDDNEDDGDIPNARRMDSQAKHGVIARGGAEWYVRLPKPGYVEWIWDHAAGYVVATEAGGVVTDTEGKDIDFSLGAQLSPTVKGVLMSSGGQWHQALVDAYAAVDKKKTSSS